MEQEGVLDIEIVEVTEDSRLVKDGSLFVAIKGEQSDGHDFIPKALSQGAVGIVSQESVQACRDRLAIDSSEATWVRVKNSRQALGIIAGRFYAEPVKKLHMIGVTGTNGKTTVTYLVKTLLETQGEKAGVVGTVGYVVGDDVYEASHTTPSSVTLQRMLGKMVHAHMDHAILEVSSHALALDRLEGCRFDVVVFTNLTQDHLDFHENMETYFQAKQRLFVEYLRNEGKANSVRAIINEDDPWGARLKRVCPAPVWTYGIYGKPDVHATNIRYTMKNTQFSVTTPIGTCSLSSPLVGEHNVYNMLAAIGVAIERGCSLSSIQKGVLEVGAVPGRFEQVNEGQDFVVIVDYAHTRRCPRSIVVRGQTIECRPRSDGGGLRWRS
jgi:UDP-N-acetylmuramoyl-L-alanyl-D-glutamate--2,6-diaminopimelate ligase